MVAITSAKNKKINKNFVLHTYMYDLDYVYVKQTTNIIITVFSDTFFVHITRVLSVGNLSNIYRACSFFTISDPFCIDNARVIGRKIR